MVCGELGRYKGEWGVLERGFYERRPSPPGPGWRVRRRIVAQDCCCWLFGIAPGIDEFLGTGGAVSGDAIESARPMAMGCDPGEVPGMYRNVIPNFFYWAMSG